MNLINRSFLGYNKFGLSRKAVQDRGKLHSIKYRDQTGFGFKTRTLLRQLPAFLREFRAAKSVEAESPTDLLQLSLLPPVSFNSLFFEIEKMNAIYLLI